MNVFNLISMLMADISAYGDNRIDVRYNGYLADSINIYNEEDTDIYFGVKFDRHNDTVSTITSKLFSVLNVSESNIDKLYVNNFEIEHTEDTDNGSTTQILFTEW